MASYCPYVQPTWAWDGSSERLTQYDGAADRNYTISADFPPKYGKKVNIPAEPYDISLVSVL